MAPIRVSNPIFPRSGLHSHTALSVPFAMAWNAGRVPSIDTTTMSLPGFLPASWMAWMAPSAMSSLCA